MAAGRATLVWTLALLALVGAAAAGRRGRFKPPNFKLPVANLLLGGSCLPANFTAELPQTLTDTVRGCVRSSFLSIFQGRSRRSPEPEPEPEPRRFRGRGGGGRGGGGRGHGLKDMLMKKLTEKLECIALGLNITSEGGALDEAALDTFLESLSSDTDFTAGLTASADVCVRALNRTLNTTSLTGPQQGVFALKCIKLRQKADCQLQNETTTEMLFAKTLVMCPLGIKSLVNCTAFDKTVFEACKDAIPDDATMSEKKNAKLNCTLQAAGLASGDAVDLDAVEAAINASESTTEAEQALQQDVLTTCRAQGADTVQAFLDCWAENSVDGCVTSIALRIATGQSLAAFKGKGKFCRGKGRGRGKGRDSGQRGQDRRGRVRGGGRSRGGGGRFRFGSG